MASLLKTWSCFDGKEKLGDVAADTEQDAIEQIKLRWPETKAPKAVINEALDEAKKKKKPYSSVTIGMGDPEVNIEHFNKMAGTDEASLNADTAKADTTAEPTDAGSCEGGLCEAVNELDEDKIFSTKSKEWVELPENIHILDKVDVANFVKQLKPEEQFHVGYVRQIYFYKKLLSCFSLIKCTELTGYTGIDYWDTINDNSDNAAGREQSDNQIANPLLLTTYNKSRGRTGVWQNTTVKTRSKFAANNGRYKHYDDINKTVTQKNQRVVKRDENGDSIKTDEIVTDLKTILFYPMRNSKPVAHYYCDFFDGKGYRPLSEKQLKYELYQQVMTLTATGVKDGDIAKYQDETELEQKFVGDVMAKVQKVIDDDAATGSSATLSSEENFEADVRALYTSQIYYIGNDRLGKLGAPLTEALETGAEHTLTEAKRYVRRYYIKPQNIFCSNKTDIIKALIDIDDKDCTVYTLNNLGDEKDVSKLTSDDIIYIYKDEILFDKNGVKVMDYDLYIKHEENRDSINPDSASDAKFNDVYHDRITDADLDDDDISIRSHGNARKEGLEMNNNLIESIHKWNVSVATLMPLVFARQDDDGTIKAGPKKATLDTSFKAAVELNGYNVSLYTEKNLRTAAANIAKQTIKAILDTPSDDYHFINDMNMQIQAMLQRNWPDAAERARRDIEAEKRSYAGSSALNSILKANQATYAEALVRVFFAAKVKQITDDQKKTSGKLKAFIHGLSTEDLQLVKDWLQEHITKIHFLVPKNDDGSEIGQIKFRDTEDQDQAEEDANKKWTNAIAAFHKNFPTAIEGKDNDFEYRLTSASTDDRKDLWHTVGLTHFDVKVSEAPDKVKEMINTAKNETKQDTLDTDQMANDYTVNSYPFAKSVVLDLFSGDLYFYLNKPEATEPVAVPEEPVEEENPFDQEFGDADLDGTIKKESLTEAKGEGGVCCICGEEYDGYGNNAEPFAHGRCCDACNLKFVIPARMNAMQDEENA